MEGADLRTEPLSLDNWSDLEDLFESRGGPRHCWCMVWRRSAEEARNQAGAFRKSLLRKRVERGEPVGIVAYRGDAVVAWCSIAPRGLHRPTMAAVQASDAMEQVWSLTCFYVRRDHRRAGIMRQLIAAAEDYAARLGASIIEAYPVEPDSPSFRYGGFLSVFEDAGFQPVGRAGLRRKVYRLWLAG